MSWPDRVSVLNILVWSLVWSWMGDYLDIGTNPDEENESILSGEGTEGSDDVDDNGVCVVDAFSEMCRLKRCNDYRCLELRGLVNKMEEFLRLGSSRNVSWEILSWFKRVLRHSRLCDETRCDIPFCQYFSGQMYERWDAVLPLVKLYYDCAALKEFWKLIDLKMVLIMDTSIDWPSGRLTPEQPEIEGVNSNAKKFWKLERLGSDLEHHFIYYPVLDSTGTRYAPRPGTDFTIVCEYLEEARYVCFAEARLVGNPFMMKMEQCFFKSRKDYQDDHMTNLRKLVDCRHENISRLVCLFLLENDSLISACHYILSDRSLEEVCGMVENCREVRQIVSGLARGACFLHQKGLFFLNWKASAILCNKAGDRMIGRLHDFQYVFNFEGKSEQQLSDDEDLFTIVECLDVSCIPHELLDCPKQVGMFTDSYGLGAAWYHLITGRPLFYEYRHKGRIKQTEAIAGLVPEELVLGERWQEFVLILSNLLGPHQGRMNLGELEQL